MNAAIQPQATAGKKGKVLCVDDEPNILRSLQWLLQKDFDVVTAPSAAEGLALVKANDFDVVISDQRMPAMTGVEFLREVRSASPRAIRILLTGYSDLQAILRSVNESEVYRFINKPWNISELPKIVEQAAQIAQTQPVEPPDSEPSEDAPIAAAKSESLLLIDDSQDMLAAVKEAVGEAVEVRHASNLAEAVALINETRISVIVSETKVGAVDVTRLIRLMKRRHPEVVTVMFSGLSDAPMVTGLINEGQIYRFVPKPVRPGFLRLTINSALGKHRRLMETPSLAGRHAVEATAPQIREELLADVHKVAQQVAGGGEKGEADEAKAGLLGRFGASVKKLFGG